MVKYQAPTEDEILAHAQKYKAEHPNTPNSLFDLMKQINKVGQELGKIEEDEQPFANLDELMNNDTFEAQLNTGLYGAKTSVQRILNNNGKEPKQKTPKILVNQSTEPLNDTEFNEFMDELKQKETRKEVSDSITEKYGNHTTLQLTELQKTKIEFKAKCENAKLTIPSDWLAEIKVLTEYTVKFPKMDEMIKALAPKDSQQEEINTVYYCAKKEPATEKTD